MAIALVLGWALAAPASALEHKLTAADGAASDRLGASVAIDGDTAVVGAPLASAARGAAYVFVRFGDSWINTAKLTTADGAVGDRLGASVAIDGDTIVAGAPGVDVEGRFGTKQDQGSAYTFACTGAAARRETATLSTFILGAGGDRLGSSVAIDGNVIVAGAPGVDGEGRHGTVVDRGSVYTFTRAGTAQRTPAAGLTALDGAANDMLGDAVAIDGDTIVAGAPNHDVGVNQNQGSRAATGCRVMAGTTWPAAARVATGCSAGADATR